MDGTERDLRVLELDNGRTPAQEWYDAIRDTGTRARIRARITRARYGSFGDFKNLDGEVYEMRLDFGPGYRVYFAFNRGELIVLLVGGDKSSQRQDIAAATSYWKAYKNEAERFQRRFRE